MLKNITEFKELDSAKTTFISTISHELKTLLNFFVNRATNAFAESFNAKIT